ncbi:MAG TPA: GAF domain-containing sensor histidine kinase [Longimicrobiales bacterium]|nr:GAF domain-containing sensor histidine kinase [Longimicrobiales bacterium]
MMATNSSDDRRDGPHQDAGGPEGALARERVARREAEASVARSSLLSDADRLLHESLDYGATLRTLAGLAVDRLTDLCVLDLVEGTGEVLRFVRLREGAGPRELAEALERHPIDPTSATLAGNVLRTGLPTLQVRVDAVTLEHWSSTPEAASALAALQPHSAILVPLKAHGRTLGVMTLARTRDGAAYDARDLELATDLGRRAGLAIVNAQLYREAQAANRAKTNFLSVMSHELRTPLSAIIGYADLLEHGIDGPLNDGQKSKLARIRASSNHLLQLIEEVLAFADRGREASAIRLDETTAQDILDDVQAVAASLAEASGVELVVSAPAEPVAMRTDARMVRQILLNLITNGIKFTEEGRVAVTMEPAGDHVVFVVRDTGIGIDPEQIQDIFEPFWQAEDPMTRRIGGTGLGLSVARSFAHQLGGDVMAESRMGEGSTFTVRLPVHARENPAHPLDAPQFGIR